MKKIQNRRWAGVFLLTAAAVLLLTAVPVSAGMKSDRGKKQLSAHTAKARYLVSREVISYKSDDGWVWSNETNHTYDKKGNETYYKYEFQDWIGEDENGEAIYEMSLFERITEYDRKYNVTSCTELENGEETYRGEYKYNSKNQETEEKYYEKGELEERYTYTYKNGRLSVSRYYDSKNKLKEKNIYSYDKKGHVTKITTKNKSGKVTGTVTIKNTYSGKKLKKTVEKGEGYTLTCTYFSNGNMQTEKYRSEEENYTNRYYESGALKSEEYTSEGLYEVRKYNEDETYIYHLYMTDGYSVETTYSEGYPEKEVVTDGEYVDTYTFGYKKSKGRVKRQIKYYEGEAVEKIDFEYVKVKG